MSNHIFKVQNYFIEIIYLLDNTFVILALLTFGSEINLNNFHKQILRKC